VLINAVCPTCQTRYQVQPTLRGQPMRCPNEKCRKVFVVPNGEGERPRRADAAPEARRPGPAAPQQTGSVGDLVPILPSEINPLPEEAPPEATPPVRTPSKPEPEPAPPSWRDAPPPVRPAARPAPAEKPPAEKPPRAEKPRAEKPAAEKPVAEKPPAEKPAEPTPRRKEPAAAAKPAGSAKREKPAPLADTLVDMPAAAQARSWDAPPPVRRGKEVQPEEPVATAPAEPEAERVPEPVETPKPTPPKPSRPRGRGKAPVIIALLLLLVVGGLGTAWYFVSRIKLQEGKDRFAEALQIYKKDGFREAADKFKELQQSLPDGEEKDASRFFEALARLRADLEAPPEAGSDPNERTHKALVRVNEFVTEHRGKNLLNDNAHDLGVTLVKVVGSFVEGVVPASDDKSVGTAEYARDVKELIANLKDGLTDEELAKIDEQLGKVQKSVAEWKRREDLLARLKRLTGDPGVPAIREALRLIRLEEDNAPGFAQNPVVSEVKAKLYDGHFEKVATSYEEDGRDLDRPQAGAPPPPSLAVTPPVRKPDAAAGTGIELVMARGVLYGLERGTGQFRWALRIGLDGNRVPLRLPPSRAGRERFLVLSDNASVAQVVEDGGTVLWRYDLGRFPCLGRPLLLEQRVFLPTEDGQVHVLDLSRGRVQGRYQLGQRLSVGGALQPGTRRLWFPADDTCVYVLDVDEHRCVGVLYTGHPAGSLRSEPLILSSGGSGGYLILNQTAGVDETRLRVFALPTRFPPPLGERLAAPLKLEHDLLLRGWTWFAPFADDEKVAVVTDAGRLGLFGIRQPENADPLLFPLLAPQQGGHRLDLLLPPGGTGRGRAQVVYARGEDLWIMANGKLQRVQLGWHGMGGRTLLPGWRAPLDLGLPLHAGQVAENPDTDRSLLVLATQPAARLECLATAVDDESGTVRWQRQLGMVCRGDPLPLSAGPGDATPPLLAVDQAGALFLFDPLQYGAPAPGLAQGSGEAVRVAEALDDNPQTPPVILPGPDGTTVYEVACPGRGKQVLVRQVSRDPAGRGLKREPDRLLTLTAPLGGTPAVVGPRLLLPLENGQLWVVKLPLDGSPPRQGTNWRDAAVSASVRGHVVPLGPDQYLTADGQQGVTHWVFPNKNEPLAKGRQGQRRQIVPMTYEMKAPLAAPPLVLPPEKEMPQRVCVADVKGTVTLLDVRPDGELLPNGTWDLRGRVTNGPFLRTAADGTSRVGCVVDEHLLFWLDPLNDGKPAWKYEAAGAVVGQPQVIEGLLVVALQTQETGVFVGLDPATGKAKGEEVPSPGGVAPAISPVPFGPGRLFAPLADGTILLPERARFGAR
jgi:hypothetical protein